MAIELKWEDWEMKACEECGEISLSEKGICWACRWHLYRQKTLLAGGIYFRR